MGGIGCMSPYGEADNLFSYVKSFRGGTYERIYGTATAEL